MDDSQMEDALTLRERHPITERELLEALNRSLWEIERQRAEDLARHGKQ